MTEKPRAHIRLPASKRRNPGRAAYAAALPERLEAIGNARHAAAQRLRANPRRRIR